MVIIKILFHIKALIKRFFYYAIYGEGLKIGASTTWRNGFSIMKDKEAIIKIGNNCFFNNYCSINANKKVIIGDGTIFGENVKIYDHNHKFKGQAPIKEQGFSNAEVSIGKHCWIGSNVVILKGTNISDNCVIGAGCVLAGGVIPANSIVKSNREYLIEPINSQHKNS